MVQRVVENLDDIKPEGRISRTLDPLEKSLAG